MFGSSSGALSMQDQISIATDHIMVDTSIAVRHDVACVDDFYFSALANEEEEQAEEMFPISDEKYAEGLQFQEVLMSSLVSSNLVNSSSSSPNMEVLRRQFQQSKSEIKIQKEAGESSQSFCEICMEGKSAEEMFRNMTTCRHSYCLECIGKHVASKIQENANLVKCPDPNCRTQLEPHHCRSIVPDEVLDRWLTAMCDNMILGSSRFYCPFKDCSGVMLVDNEGEIVRESECPYCRRLFCAQCNVPWHSEISCEDFQMLDKNDTTREDLMAVELAKKLKWKRCPKCSFFVEKREGCIHITCRCGFQFCYGCGSAWTETHGDCQRR